MRGEVLRPRRATLEASADPFSTPKTTRDGRAGWLLKYDSEYYRKRGANASLLKQPNSPTENRRHAMIKQLKPPPRRDTRIHLLCMSFSQELFTVTQNTTG